MEKIAFKIVEQGDSEPTQIIKVDQTSIEDFIGSPIFQSKKIYEQTPPGVVTGLAYNAYGGALLYIEAT